MKFEYDKEVDAAYIYLEDNIMDGQVDKSVEIKENVILDYDSDGKLLDVEILNASKVIKEDTLTKVVV